MPQPLKIGITCYPSSGGSGVIATELGRQLALRGHQVHFITYDVPFRFDYSWPNVSFHPVELPHYPLFQHAPYTIALATHLAQVAQEQSLDLWHVHYAIPHAASAFLARAMLGYNGPRVVTTLHGTDITLVGSHPSFAPTVAFTLEQSDAVTAVSADLHQRTLSTFAVRRPIVTVPNFIDTTVFYPWNNAALRQRLAQPDEKVICHISNFRPAKNPLAVVEIFAQVNEQVPSRLVLVGAGPELDRVRHRSRELGVHSRVRFIGEQADVTELLSAADLFLLPSHLESFGLAALEAMACGVPVIATRVGGLPELLGPMVDECLFAPGDVQGMAAAAVKILSDDGRHRRLVDTGLRQVDEKFTAEKVVAQYEAVYYSVLGR